MHSLFFEEVIPTRFKNQNDIKSMHWQVLFLSPSLGTLLLFVPIGKNSPPPLFSSVSFSNIYPYFPHSYKKGEYFTHFSMPCLFHLILSPGCLPLSVCRDISHSSCLPVVLCSMVWLYHNLFHQDPELFSFAIINKATMNNLEVHHYIDSWEYLYLDSKNWMSSDL